MPPKDTSAKRPKVAKGTVRPRQYMLANGVPRYSKSAMNVRKGAVRYPNKLKKVVTPEKQATKRTLNLKNGKQITVVNELPSTDPKTFPTTDAIPKPKAKVVQRPTKLRSNITPGTVLIVLAGVHRGKRVIFLKQLPSGMLLVTGPYKINGVPLRRVNQAFVIATSTKVDVSGAKIDAKYTDEYFSKPTEKKNKKTEAEFFAADKEKKRAVKPEKVADQKAFDAPILEALKKNPTLAAYLKSVFSLRSNIPVHKMKF